MSEIFVKISTKSDSDTDDSGTDNFLVPESKSPTLSDLTKKAGDKRRANRHRSPPPSESSESSESYESSDIEIIKQESKSEIDREIKETRKKIKVESRDRDIQEKEFEERKILESPLYRKLESENTKLKNHIKKLEKRIVKLRR